MRQRFSPNWSLILAFIIPVWVIVFFLVWVITYPAIISVRDGTPFPSSWTWTTIFLTDSGIVVSGLIIVWGIVTGFVTEITETRISRHLFFWHNEINLIEIRQVLIRNYRLVLIDEKQKFTINLMFYKKPDDVLSFIKKHTSGLN